MAHVLFGGVSFSIMWHLSSLCILRLREAAAQSEDEQRALVRCQLQLQENIETEANALYIDEVVCPQHREPIIIHHF